MYHPTEKQIQITAPCRKPGPSPLPAVDKKHKTETDYLTYKFDTVHIMATNFAVPGLCRLCQRNPL